MKNKLLFFSLISAGVLLLDQGIKLFILKGNFSYTTNTGAGFGILPDTSSVLVWISIFVLGIILYHHDKLAKEDKFLHFSTALLFGGTLGNLIDRVRLGYVIDFIDLGFWPSFNIADLAITAGAIGLLIYSFRKK